MPTSIATALAAFTVAAFLLTILPGPDTALMLRTSTAEGPRKALATALGIAIGMIVWAAIVAMGLGALLKASTLAYTVLRWVGAAYLGWLALQMILKPRAAFELGGGESRGPGLAASLARGFLTNMLNPKVGVFYVSFLPQFIPSGVSVAAFVMLLAAIHIALTVIWFGVLIAATRPLARALRRPGVLKALDRATGAVFLAFGLRLALEAD